MRTDDPILSLFSGVGGVEHGLSEAGLRNTVGFYESWEAAQAVLKDRFEDIPQHGDISSMKNFHGARLVTAGFPCTDLSQAGRTVGLDGAASGLIRRVLELLPQEKPDWLLIENVPNMLHLGSGRALGEITLALQQAGYDWAYRVMDSRAFGLPQRRRRVYLLASHVYDPAAVLYRSDCPSLRKDGGVTGARSDAFGFYWTEGNRGIGWAIDAIPALKGSTTVSIPSPPAIWLPRAVVGHKIVRPSITSAERLQGLPEGWTAAAPTRDRWKLLGNAVSSPAARWIGEGLVSLPDPSLVDGLQRYLQVEGARWPLAAHYRDGKTWRTDVSEWPTQPSGRHRHLSSLLRTYGSEPLSLRATTGFRNRLARSTLRYSEDFMRDLNEHIAAVSV
ncbi:DNA (cytosine-5)-methyltransferase 1 [Pseudonocardia hierapolitana]|uniref:DNA (cytosine-5-)-methyltransferase n=1 Tax=Pseudonocardia hierapolitana TaxID=1128676 RepID=A0A561SL69_9PSEU|nr:DNA (cytosine-5-)-methyltransferase [Pseudonocardia hierapolitana]TWF75625.1 DNA (cytosine-5)-methyltransferase 1 [Pseudonocardia hierapolitana]